MDLSSPKLKKDLFFFQNKFLWFQKELEKPKKQKGSALLIIFVHSYISLKNYKKNLFLKNYNSFFKKSVLFFSKFSLKNGQSSFETHYCKKFCSK